MAEYRELDLRIHRQCAAYLLATMRGRTMASLASHVQQLVLQAIETHHSLNQQQHPPPQGAAAPPHLHLPASIKQLNAVLGVTASEDVGLAGELLLLGYEESVALVEGSGMAPQELIDIKVCSGRDANFYHLSKGPPLFDSPVGYTNTYLSPQEGVARHISSRVVGVFEELSGLLSGGELVVLLPGQPYTHERTAVLLQGSLEPNAEVSAFLWDRSCPLGFEGGRQYPDTA